MEKFPCQPDSFNMIEDTGNPKSQIHVKITDMTSSCFMQSCRQDLDPDVMTDCFVTETSVQAYFEMNDDIRWSTCGSVDLPNKKKARLRFLSHLLDLVWSTKQKMILKKIACFLLFSVKPPRHRQTCGNWANTINVACGVALWTGNDSGWVKVGDVEHDEEDLAGRGTGGGEMGDN